MGSGGPGVVITSRPEVATQRVVARLMMIHLLKLETNLQLIMPEKVFSYLRIGKYIRDIIKE